MLYYNIFTLNDLRLLLIKYPNIFKNNKNKDLNISPENIYLIQTKLQLEQSFP